MSADMSHRTFDPNMGDAASIEEPRTLTLDEAAYLRNGRDDAPYFWDRRSNREVRAVMAARTGVCG